jgi:signal transduction histidine kinase
VRKDGSRFWADVLVVSLRDAAGAPRGFAKLTRDMSDRRLYEERLEAQNQLLARRVDEQSAELRELAAIANSAREQEKSRIARELHDEIAQALTVLSMDLRWIEQHALADPQVLRTKLGSMADVVEDAMVSTRRIAADLRPLMLDDLGFVPAAEWLVDNFSRRTGVSCAFRVDPEDVELVEPQATAAFRIVQESLNNIGRHARASRAEVSVRRDAERLSLRVSDDGCGFDPGTARKPQSMGLAGLRERVLILKGELSIDSAPGRGTAVEVRLPL